ncbi:MAG: hypothetical protein H0W88_08075 [Parachlamydiaceae bacterium]|nr:hypothetical protein [Parachlamydiaceae bacterium]
MTALSAPLQAPNRSILWAAFQFCHFFEKTISCGRSYMVLSSTNQSLKIERTTNKEFATSLEDINNVVDEILGCYSIPKETQTTLTSLQTRYAKHFEKKIEKEESKKNAESTEEVDLDKDKVKRGIKSTPISFDLLFEKDNIAEEEIVKAFEFHCYSIVLENYKRCAPKLLKNASNNAINKWAFHIQLKAKRRVVDLTALFSLSLSKIINNIEMNRSTIGDNRPESETWIEDFYAIFISNLAPLSKKYYKPQKMSKANILALILMTKFTPNYTHAQEPELLDDDCYQNFLDLLAHKKVESLFNNFFNKIELQTLKSNKITSKKNQLALRLDLFFKRTQECLFKKDSENS